MTPGVRQNYKRAVAWDHVRVEFAAARLNFCLDGARIQSVRQFFLYEWKVLPLIREDPRKSAALEQQ